MNILAVNLFAIETMTIVGIAVLGLFLVLMFVYPSLTNKKRQKQITELYKSVDVGDKIKTVGGIIGTVIQVNEINALESEIVIETGVGDNKTTLVFDMQAVYQNLTKMAARAQAASESSEKNDVKNNNDDEETSQTQDKDN